MYEMWDQHKNQCSFYVNKEATTWISNDNSYFKFIFQTRTIPYGKICYDFPNNSMVEPTCGIKQFKKGHHYSKFKFILKFESGVIINDCYDWLNISVFAFPFNCVNDNDQKKYTEMTYLENDFATYEIHKKLIKFYHKRNCTKNKNNITIKIPFLSFDHGIIIIRLKYKNILPIHKLLAINIEFVQRIKLMILLKS